MDKNLTLVLYGVNDLRLENRPIPEPKDGEVQVSIRSVGICGTGCKFWKHGHVGNLVVKDPLVLGHEPSGVVTKLGPGVTHLQEGDRVAIEPNEPCGSCHCCKIGRYNVCENLKYLACPPTDGCLARYCCHPADYVYKLPDNMSFDEGACVQPLALGFYACERGRVSVGDYVLVSGAGPLGMAVVLAAKARGVAKICVTETHPKRLEFIKKVGADFTVFVEEDEDPKVTSQRVVKAIGREVDVSIECSGHQQGTSTAIYSTRTAGTVVQSGFGGATVEIPLVIATLRELDIRGMCRFSNNYERVIEAISSGKVDVKQLVTHRFKLENAVDAYTAAFNQEGVKIIVDCEAKSSSSKQQAREDI